MRTKTETRAPEGAVWTRNGHEPVLVYMGEHEAEYEAEYEPVVFQYEYFGAISNAGTGQMQSVSKKHARTRLQVSVKTNKSNSRQKRVPKPELLKTDL